MRVFRAESAEGAGDPAPGRCEMTARPADMGEFIEWIQTEGL